jgi:hypothetical protein
MEYVISIPLNCITSPAFHWCSVDLPNSNNSSNQQKQQQQRQAKMQQVKSCLRIVVFFSCIAQWLSFAFNIGVSLSSLRKNVGLSSFSPGLYVSPSNLLNAAQSMSRAKHSISLLNVSLPPSSFHSSVPHFPLPPSSLPLAPLLAVPTSCHLTPSLLIAAQSRG